MWALARKVLVDVPTWHSILAASTNSNQHYRRKVANLPSTIILRFFSLFSTIFTDSSRRPKLRTLYNFSESISPHNITKYIKKPFVFALPLLVPAVKYHSCTIVIIPSSPKTFSRIRKEIGTAELYQHWLAGFFKAKDTKILFTFLSSIFWIPWWKLFKRKRSCCVLLLLSFSSLDVHVQKKSVGSTRQRRTKKSAATYTHDTFYYKCTRTYLFFLSIP